MFGKKSWEEAESRGWTHFGNMIPDDTKYNQSHATIYEQDEATTAQLKYGSCLMELLKQPLCSPLSLHQQVITLCVATHKLMVDVEKKEIKKYQKDLLEYFDNVYPEIGKEIETTKQLSDELVEKIVKAAEEFRDKSR